MPTGSRNTEKTHCPQGHPYSGDNLYISTKGYRQCRLCLATQARQWRVANPKRSRELNRQTQQSKMDFVREVLGTECVDCPEDRLDAIQYHHPRGRKYGHEHGLSALSWPRLKDEIMLMIPLCATCHQVRHHNEGTLGRPRVDQEAS